MLSVYALTDPRTDQIHYIGISKNARLRYAQHTLAMGRNSDQRKLWILDLRSQDLYPSLLILEENLTQEQGREREKYWIKHYLMQGMPLTNFRHRQKNREGYRQKNREGYMNVMEAARYLGISDKTIRRAIGAGKLKARYPSVNRAEIDVSDLEQWYATTTIRATPDETQQRLAALERQVQALSSEVHTLQQSLAEMTNTGVSLQHGQVSRQHKQVAPDTVPDGFTWLSDFADLHGISRNEAQRRWQMGMITGQKINTGKRRAPVAIAESGKHDFWVQFHGVEGFYACDDCPHKRDI